MLQGFRTMLLGVPRYRGCVGFGVTDGAHAAVEPLRQVHQPHRHLADVPDKVLCFFLLRKFSKQLDHVCGCSLHVVVAATDFGPERVEDVESGLLSFKCRQQAVHALAQQPGLLEAAQVHDGVYRLFAHLGNSVARLGTQFIRSPRQCLAEVLELQHVLVLDRPGPVFGYPRPLTTAEKVLAVRRAFQPRCRCSCLLGGLPAGADVSG